MLRALSHILAMLAAVALSPLPAAAQANSYRIGELKIDDAWLRMPPPAAKVAGGFMTITNTGAAADRLIGGSAVNAGRFEVHEMAVTDGVMRMRPLQAGLEIKPGETVTLRPGSYHVMLIDLQAAPEAGKPLKGTLVFEKAGTVEIEYKVEAAGARASGNGGSGSGSGSGSGAPAAKGSGSGSGSGSGAGSGSGSGAGKNAN